MKRTLVAVVLALGLSAPAAAAPAPTPPKDCGFIKVGGKRFNIKADLDCGKARKYSRDRIRRGSTPKGFSCTDFGAETSIAFQCSKGAYQFFAIRR